VDLIFDGTLGLPGLIEHADRYDSFVERLWALFHVSVFVPGCI
jgi:hypothetical protein